MTVVPNKVEPGALADGHQPTDVGNADRLVAAADGEIRYVHAWQKWLVWEGGRWVLDHGDTLVIERAKRVADRMRKMAVEVGSPERDELWKHAKRSEAASMVTAMVRLARGVPGIVTDHEALDADPWLLNLENGTVDVRTGQLRPHNPDDLLTLQAPVTFDPAADAPLWRACIERWLPDAGKRSFLQRALGSAITGHPVEALFVNFGNGGNGKGKCFGAVMATLGDDYSTVPNKSLLVAQKHEQHATVLASLFRARMIVAAETSKGDRLDEESVKNLTGGDRLRARRMREDEWSFDPTWTAFIHTNDRPRISGTDDGIWRRVHLIPWDVTIPETERDDQLAGKLAAERAGILNWLLEGCAQWIADGLAPPDEVRTATRAYRIEQDDVGRFLTECCELDDNAYETIEAIRDRYERWCNEAGDRPMSGTALGKELNRRHLDVTTVTVNGQRKRCRLGIRLISEGVT